MNHLILFDGTCPFCAHWIKSIMHWDKKQIFRFAPLQGETAIKYLGKQAKDKDAVVLIENISKGQILTEGGRAILRIFWLLKGKWRLLGWLYFIPFGSNFFYRIIAHRRHRFSRSFPIWTEEEKQRILS